MEEPGGSNSTIHNDPLLLHWTSAHAEQITNAGGISSGCCLHPASRSPFQTDRKRDGDPPHSKTLPERSSLNSGLTFSPQLHTNFNLYCPGGPWRYSQPLCAIKKYSERLFHSLNLCFSRWSYLCMVLFPIHRAHYITPTFRFMMRSILSITR